MTSFGDTSVTYGKTPKLNISAATLVDLIIRLVMSMSHCMSNEELLKMKTDPRKVLNFPVHG